MFNNRRVATPAKSASLLLQARSRKLISNIMTSCRIRSVRQLCWPDLGRNEPHVWPGEPLRRSLRLRLASPASLLCRLACGLSRPSRKTVPAARRESLASARRAPSDSRKPSLPSLRRSRSGPAGEGRSTGSGPRSTPSLGEGMRPTPIGVKLGRRGRGTQLARKTG